jgi:hypothetical protein
VPEKGAALTYAPIQARGCPSRSAFSAPPSGRASSAALEVEISTFRIEQQPRLRELFFVKSVLVVFVFLCRGEITPGPSFKAIIKFATFGNGAEETGQINAASWKLVDSCWRLGVWPSVLPAHVTPGVASQRSLRSCAAVA